MQIIPEFSCARKETVDIDMLVAFRNGQRETMQSIRITSKPPSRIRKCNQNICQNNTCRKDLSWLHFDDEPRKAASEEASKRRMQVKQASDQQSCISVFLAYLIIPSSN